ncbi:MAG: ASPIC/UnbV domain-containing protein [Planctomycetes bacterium]|nr:ASPIC/UnbV domain-containing protein [Planctomycetota bacterium]
MRSDPSGQTQALRQSEAWQVDPFTDRRDKEMDLRFQRGGTEDDGQIYRHSHSGHERNRFFLNQRGQRFDDLSIISGLDTAGDSRSLVLWDFDHDGRQDIAVVNADRPLLNLYHNQIGVPMDGNDESKSDHRFIAVRFVGGNGQSKPSSEWACRDGYGTQVTVELDGMKLLREHRCGEGFAAQNSATMLIGIGDDSAARVVTVRWPSGKTMRTENVPSGTLLVAYENPADAPGSERLVRRPYRPVPAAAVSPTTDDAPLTLILDSARRALPRKSKAPRLRMYTTMATWCAPCVEHLPQFARLRKIFSRDELAMFGVPIDPEDDREKLKSYSRRHRPAYRLLDDLVGPEREQVKSVLIKALGKEPPLPSTVVTDRKGTVLATFSGAPSVSQIRKLLETQSQ